MGYGYGLAATQNKTTGFPVLLKVGTHKHPRLRLLHSTFHARDIQRDAQTVEPLSDVGKHSQL